MSDIPMDHYAMSSSLEVSFVKDSSKLHCDHVMPLIVIM